MTIDKLTKSVGDDVRAGDSDVILNSELGKIEPGELWVIVANVLREIRYRHECENSDRGRETIMSLGLRVISRAFPNVSPGATGVFKDPTNLVFQGKLTAA